MLNRVCLGLIAVYQNAISPFLPKRCRFYPSCSEYAKEAFKTQSLKDAWVLSIKRICRCHPFCEGGVDYVPVRSKEKC